jgi:exosortase D (VPLPA-CTERM-specific)
MPDSSIRFKITLGGLVTIGIYTALITAIYFSTLSWLILHDWAIADFTYAYILPAVIVYLLWEKRDKLVRTPSVSSWSGMAFLVPGIVLFWLGELSGEYFSQYMSLWLTVAGLCWLHLGREKLKIMAPAFFISLAMFPPPNTIYIKISLKLKLISSWLGVWMMQLAGLSVHREGNVIDLGFNQLQVVDACSGLRYLIPLIVLGILLVYFSRGSLWKKIAIVLSTIPLSIVTNSLRIAITGILSQYFGPEVAEGFFHDFAGWFIFMFSLGMLLLLMWLLGKIDAKLSNKTQE